MYTANVTVGATATSLRDLINTAVPGEVPAIAAYTGRIYEVVLIPSAITVLLSSRGGTPPPNNAVPLVANVPITFQAITANQISLDEIFLSGTGSCAVMVLTM
jgi:hypothetical protein